MGRVLLLCAVFGAVPLWAQAHAPFSVAVAVTAPDLFQGRLTTAILRELRKNPDVVVASADSATDFELSVACLHNDRIGILACSSVTSRPFHGVRTLGEQFPTVKKSYIWQVVHSAEDSFAKMLLGQEVFTTAESRPNELAQMIEAQFELDAIEPERKSAADLLPAK